MGEDHHHGGRHLHPPDGWNLSKGHPHFDEPPVRSRADAIFRVVWWSWPVSDLFLVLQAYPYLHIRNKEFPQGMNCLPLPSCAHFNAYVCKFLLDLTGCDVIFIKSHMV